MIFLFIIMEWPYKMSLYLACRCRWTLQSGQDKWHHSGRAWTSIHWCQSHNVGRHIPGHIDTGKTPLCSHIFQNAHMGLHLLVEGKGLNMEHIQKKNRYNNTAYTAYNNRTWIWQEKKQAKKKQTCQLSIHPCPGCRHPLQSQQDRYKWHGH